MDENGEKNGKNMGGYQRFEWKKSKIWKKSGGGCDFGQIWENIPYVPGISPPLPGGTGIFPAGPRDTSPKILR